MELWPPKSWPAILVGLMLLTYWLRVMQMVRKTKKVAGHHANLIPEEKLGRALRIIWIPAVVLWIFLPLLAGFGILVDNPVLRPIADTSMLAWPAAALAAVAYGLTWVCWFRMGKSWRMGIDPNDKTQLVFNGPFAFVRNPIYGLSQLLMFLTIVIVPSPALLVIGVIHILLMQWEVRREEVYLTALHGESYIRYLQNVGRFLPRSLRAYRP
jgi:protein-S-isoprenylcysteine O-methyltransferase Ste14